MTISSKIVSTRSRTAGSRGRNTRPARSRARAAGDPEAAGFLPSQEPIRHLHQDAGAVAGVHLAAARPAVEQVDEQLQRLADDAVALLTLDVDDEADAAGVVLVPRIVEPLRRDRLVAGGAGVCCTVSYRRYRSRSKTGFSDWVHAFRSCTTHEKNCWRPSSRGEVVASRREMTKTDASGQEILCLR